MLSIELECLQQSQVLAYVPAHSEVVDADVFQCLIGIDEESASQSDSSIIQNSIVSCNFFFEVGYEWNINLPQSSLIPRLQSPSPMHIVRIDRTSHNLTLMVSKSLSLVAKLHNLSGTHKRKVQRIEEEQQPLRLVVIKRYLLEVIGRCDPRIGFEERCGFADYCFDCLTCHMIYLSKLRIHIHRLYSHFCSDFIISTNYMDKYTDATLADAGAGGLYTQHDINELQSLEKIKHGVDLTILCNKVCFKDYTSEMSEAESECHNRCFDNLYASLLFTQNKFFNEINRKN